MGCGIMFPRDFSVDGGGERPPVVSLFQLIDRLPNADGGLPDDADDFDLDVASSKVQNNLYANNDDEEEDEGEDLEGRKVMVRFCLMAGM